MAISTQAKAFLASPVTQQVVNDIYSGRVVYSVATYRSILADNYKPRAIEIYDPLSAPFLNHYRSEIVPNIAPVVVTRNFYRLRAPKYRAYFEYVNFTLLLVTFLLCISSLSQLPLKITNPYHLYHL
jgi:hypothetical protein